jgi:hypothetical protein
MVCKRFQFEACNIAVEETRDASQVYKDLSDGEVVYLRIIRNKATVCSIDKEAVLKCNRSNGKLSQCRCGWQLV